MTTLSIVPGWNPSAGTFLWPQDWIEPMASYLTSNYPVAMVAWWTGTAWKTYIKNVSSASYNFAMTRGLEYAIYATAPFTLDLTVRITLTGSTAVEKGTTATYTGVISGPTLDVSNEPIDIYIDNVYYTTLYSDANGNYSVNVTWSLEGTHTLKAVWTAPRTL